MLNCTWTFYSMSGNKMKALIKDFIMEESWNCEWDYFNIYDGPDQQSRLLGKLNLLKCPMLRSIHMSIYIIMYMANMIYICLGSNIICCQRLHQIFHQNPEYYWTQWDEHKTTLNGSSPLIPAFLDFSDSYLILSSESTLVLFFSGSHIFEEFLLPKLHF